MTHQVYEWTIITPDGPSGSVWTMGPHGPRDEIENGKWEPVYDHLDEPMYDGDGEPIMRKVREQPAGSYVGRRVVTYGPWQRCEDDSLTPQPRDREASALLAQLDDAIGKNADRFPDNLLPDSIRDSRIELVSSLGDIELDAQEERIVRWLLEWDQPTLQALASIIRKARAAD